MKTIIYGMAVSLGFLANGASAEQMISVNGVEYALSALMTSCQEKTDDAAEQIACFNNVSKLLQEQTAAAEENVVSVPDALSALRDVAVHEGGETGLSIVGEGCSIQVIYFGNYFHISRRNISTIDVFSASFDASKVQLDKSVRVQGSQSPLSRAQMDAGAEASVTGGMALESAQQGFAPKSSRETTSEFAINVLGQLPSRTGPEFEFVLVHPDRSGSEAEIWGAFETYVTACKG